MAEAATKERGILMHARSVNGILAGQKTQTRRIVKPQPAMTLQDGDVSEISGHEMVGPWCHFYGESEPVAGTTNTTRPMFTVKCPYGQPGDRLWVRETFALGSHNTVAYRADGACGAIGGDGDGNLVFYRHGWIVECGDHGDGRYFGLKKYGGRWRPSIHMPRKFSRITLEITDVRVERVQDISATDVVAEGATERLRSFALFGMNAEERRQQYCAVFEQLWDDTNGKGAWDRNDWCWVVEFERVQ